MSLIEDLRVRIGLDSADTSRDDEINAAKDSAWALMGNYCDRIFPLATDIEEKFTHKVGMGLSLKQFPIVSITSIIDNLNNNITAYHEDALSGIIYLDFFGVFHFVTVLFSGGYDENLLPADLLQAFLAVFDQEFELGEGGAVSSSGDISSVTVPDVGTVRYNTALAESGAAAGSYLPDRAKGILGNYLRYQC